MATITLISSQYDLIWTLDGNTHREQGPAIIENNGTKYWYLEGVRIDEEYAKDNPINYLL